MSCSGINDIIGAKLFFKCENFQKVGAFKFRGACNSVMMLTKVEAQKGVATHSSGNHAAAIALAARNMGIKAYIVMPENTPEIKKKAVASYSAEITYCKSTLEARESTLNEVVKKTGAAFIHPYNNYNVISGQGTAIIEVLEEYPDMEVVMAPIGGGGLMSGTSIAAKTMKPSIIVYGAEPKNADDAYQSFYSGAIVPSQNPQTIADGLRTSLSDMTFQIIRERVNDIFTAQEQTIIEAMHLIWERMKIIIEPSSAVPLAAIMENKEKFAGKRVLIILSGGNVDLNKLPF
jgi:threonine dehydratase